MQFLYTILYVPDPVRTMDFYTRAFGFAVRLTSPDGDYGELETGQTRLCFAATEMIRGLGKDPAETPVARPAFEIALATDDVPAALARAVEAGGTEVMAPTQMPWGQVISYIKDPDGTLVEICEPT